MRVETLDQLREFDASLKKMTSGNVGLVSQLASVQLVISPKQRTLLKIRLILNNPFFSFILSFLFRLFKQQLVRRSKLLKLFECLPK